jgi:hypothetical protein
MILFYKLIDKHISFFSLRVFREYIRAAIYKGENPFCDWQLILALCLTKILTTSSCPANDAIWRAVFPFYINKEIKMING